MNQVWAFYMKAHFCIGLIALGLKIIHLRMGGKVEIVKLEIGVPKEMQDVSVLLQNIVKAIKAKKGVAEIAASELADLIAAVEGYDKIGDEVKSPEASDCIALLGSGIYKALTA